MKTIKIILGFIIVLGFASCTKDFVEINKNPNAITPDEASAKYFITGPQYKLYSPDRFPYWRAHLIHVDRYAGHFCFGFNGSWWDGELGYKYSSGYTDAAFGWLDGYFGEIDNFMKLTKTGGDFENPLMYATGQIIKAIYYQMFTDLFGELPFTEAGDTSIVLPKFDTQNTIYQGVIDLLDEAIATIGDNTTTGDGVQNLGTNDLYCGGDLQLWKKLANTLKLRMALRAHGASGATWVDGAINEALAGPLLAEGENILMDKDAEISQWGSACYGDVWHNFGGLGSKWTVGKVLIDFLRDYNDPRLDKYAKPAAGGTSKYKRPDQATNDEGYTNFPERMNYFDGLLNTATGGDYTVNAWPNLTAPDSVEFSVPENKHYIGQPPRLNGQTYPYSKYEFWSTPSDKVTAKKNSGTAMYDEHVMTAAESFFLQAQAAVLGYGSGNANQLYQSGVTEAMALWGAAPGDYFLGTNDMGSISGDAQDEQLRKIGVQRWILNYTEGFEAFAVVRDFGAPVEMADGVSNIVIYGLGDDNGVFPQRMRYGNQAYNQNLDNLNAAIARQGADVQGTKLWWAK